MVWRWQSEQRWFIYKIRGFFFYHNKYWYYNLKIKNLFTKLTQYSIKNNWTQGALKLVICSSQAQYFNHKTMMILNQIDWYNFTEHFSSHIETKCNKKYKLWFNKLHLFFSLLFTTKTFTPTSFPHTLPGDHDFNQTWCFSISEIYFFWEKEIFCIYSFEKITNIKGSSYPRELRLEQTWS